jgi:hypothetical protein
MKAIVDETMKFKYSVLLTENEDIRIKLSETSEQLKLIK